MKGSAAFAVLPFHRFSMLDANNCSEQAKDLLLTEDVLC